MPQSLVPEPSAASTLFAHVARLQGGRRWGAVLDAGTGVNSMRWVLGLETDRWTAVTGSADHGAQVRDALEGRDRPQDRLLLGNWLDGELLKGEVFDTVLADYLLGAVEGFSPYFQQDLFRRLRPHVGGRLYVIGLDPYVLAAPAMPAEAMAREIGRLRDVCLLLAGETPYREYPAEWAVTRLEADGYRVLSARRFANRYKARWINSQLDMAARRAAKIGDPALAGALHGRIGALREEALELARAQNGLRAGADWVIAAEPV